MPIYSIKAPDGMIYDIKAPEGATQNQLFGFLSSQIGRGQSPAQQDLSQMSTEQLEAAPSAPTSISDIARSLQIGGYGGFKSLADVLGAGSDVSKSLGAKMEEAYGQLTPERRAEIGRRQELERRAAESGDLGREIKTFLGGVAEAPLQSTAQAVGSSAPAIIAGLAAIPAGAPAGLAIGVGTIAKFAVGAAQGVGEYKGSVFDAVKEEYKKRGLSDLEAEALAVKAQEYSADKALEIGGSALLGALDAFTGFEGSPAAMLRKRSAQEFAKKFVAEPTIGRALVKNIAQEAPIEGMQGGFGQFAENLALGREGVDISPGQGVLGAAARDALIGGLAGAAFSPMELSGMRRDYEAAKAARQEEEFKQFEADKAKALEEMAKAPQKPEEPVKMPGGFTIQREEIGRETRPESYGIFVEGQDKPLTSVESQEQADAKIESFKQIREKERESLLSQMDKLNEEVQKRRERIDYLEATGQTATEEYQQAKAILPEQELTAETKARELAEQMEQLGKPLTAMPIGQKETVQEQYKVISPTGNIFETHATQGEAEASVRKLLGEEVFKQAEQKKARDERIVDLEKNLVPALKKFGLGDVALKVVDQIENNAGGSYLNKLIKIAYDEANPVQTMRHEVVHALKDLGFFTPQQWKALEERAKKEWIKQHLEGQMTEIDGQQMSRLEGYRKIGMSEDAIIEEAIADAFGAYDKGATPPPGLIASLLKRLKNFFANFGQALRGAGFESAEDIFQRVERGELKGTQQPSGEAKMSLAPEGVPQKIWDLHEKSIAADEAANQWNVGQTKANATKATRRLLQAVAEHVGNDDHAQIEFMVKMNQESTRRGESVPPAAKFSVKKTGAKERPSVTKEAVTPAQWKATSKDIEQADAYLEENGIMPYTSEGQIEVPLDVSGTKYSIKKPYEQKAMSKDQTLKNDPLTGLPMNANGTVTLYFPTDNEGARELARTKRLKGSSPTANRIYLTNESSAPVVQNKPGMIDQPLGGANVLLQVDPSLLHLLEEHDDGRKDFFIPIAEGEYFAKKMAQTKLFTLNAPRTKGLHPDRTLSQVTKMVNETATKWASATKTQQAEMARDAKKVLKDEHNIEKLFGANAKLEKTNIGEYGLTYNGKKVMSTGLGFASAQKINDEQRATTCPQSAICEALCLGETSGQNLLYGGEGEFRSGPRLSQFLKTEALVVNPEAFAITLIKQIETFRNAAKKLGYQPAIRLNVTSDFNPKTFENIIKMFPDVMFYDYTKLDTKPIAENHHLTYSSTGASQVVNGETVVNKESNWDRMVDKVLSNGKNVAMAFTSRNDMPKEILDERTGKRFQVWNGDEYDARFLDPTREDGRGWIIGLTNKDRTTKPEDAAKKHNGFFLDYDKARDGEVLVIRDQNKLAGKPSGKTIPIAKYSLKAPTTPEFKKWFGESKVVDADGKPMVVYHGTSAYDELADEGEEAIAQFNSHINWFSPDEYLASGYATKDGKQVESAAIYPAYVSVKNPFVVKGDLNDKITYAEARKEFGLNVQPGPYSDEIDEFGVEASVPKWWIVNSVNFKELAEQKGFDGVKAYENKTLTYGAFHPTQIKSATGNIGTFDATNPDIRYSLKTSFATPEAAERAAHKKAPPQTKEFKQWFGASTIIEEGRPQVMYHASPSQFEVFYERKPIFVSSDPEKAQQFSALKRLGRGIKRDYIYPLWVRAETPFDFDNEEHVQLIAKYLQDNHTGGSEVAGRIKMGDLGPVTMDEVLGDLRRGKWRTIESAPMQEGLKSLGFDSFYVYENNTKNLAVYSANQVKSVTGNIGEFGTETKDIRFSLKKFDKNDLPQNKRMYVLPQDTLIYHGAYKERADQIEQSGGALLSRPPMRVSGGATNEGGLIFFGDENTAKNFAENKADLRAVESARQAGVERLPGKVFETATDRPYKLVDRKHKMSAREAKDLTKALGLPDYKELSAGDSLEIAATRATDYSDSNIDRYQVTRRTGQGKETISAPWPVIFRTLGVDGFYDNLGIALTSDNGIRLVGKDGKLEKYSLPKMPSAIDGRVSETTTRRDPEGFAERITKAISPQGFSYFRQKAINRYNQLSAYDKKLAEQMGGVDLLADQSAEAAALMSDLGAGVAASAMGYGDRHGGIPVYKNGITTIDRSVKGLIAALGPLAKYGDPKIYQYYQYWAMVKRGVRLNAQGKETGVDATDVQYAKYLQEKFPEFVQVQKDFIAFNNGLVKYARDTGVISEQNAQEFMKYADYVPFYRQMDGETTVGPNIFQSIAGVRAPKKLKGGTAPLADFLETAVRNTTSMIQAGMKNAAAQQVVKVTSKVKAPGMGIERLDHDANGPDVFHVLENGKRVSYRTPDHLLLDAISSLHMPELPFMGILSAPANALRNLVTKDPGFMMANLMRDSLSAWVTSGQNMTPIAGTVINFGKIIAKKSKGYEALIDAGVIGGYELSQNVERSGRELEKDLAKKAGKKAPLPLRPFTWLWEGLEKGTEASDAATRALVYERVLNETGNEAEALYRSLEVMNFNRKGNSPVIRILTAAVPFLNARIQGLDLFYRASTGNMNMADKKAIQRKFWVRGATMMALSAMYWFMVHDDDDYKAQEQETKDNNWILPSLGIRIPIPFEVGVLFKTIPERIAAYSFGSDTGQDFADSIKRNALSTFAFNPIPQTVKPIIEATANFNFFTWRPIVGQGMSDVAAEFQVGPGTSKMAKAIGETLGLSPMKIDHIIKGYTGTMGMYAIDTMDHIMDQFGDNPKAAKRFEQMPIIKRFAVDPAARGTVTAYYELKDAVDTTVRTMNLLEKSMEPEKFAKYMQENMGVLAVKDYVSDLEKSMKEFREMRQLVNASGMGAEEKRDALLTITQSENNLTKNIQEVKKAIASMR